MTTDEESLTLWRWRPSFRFLIPTQLTELLRCAVTSALHPSIYNHLNVVHLSKFYLSLPFFENFQCKCSLALSFSEMLKTDNVVTLVFESSLICQAGLIALCHADYSISHFSVKLLWLLGETAITRNTWLGTGNGHPFILQLPIDVPHFLHYFPFLSSSYLLHLILPSWSDNQKGEAGQATKIKMKALNWITQNLQCHFLSS